MRPILFQIGDFRFYSFGLMAALALIVPGLTIVRPLVRRRGVPEEFAYELIIAAGIGGFVFARIYYLIENYAADQGGLLDVAFSGAGFVWYGGLIGGFLGVVGWTLVRRYPLDVVANAMAPATAFGYLIGRIGCQLAGDGDYGKVSTLPWAMGYPHGTVPTPPGVRVQPTPIYEIIAMASSSGSSGGWRRATTSPAGGRSAGSSSSPASSASWWSSCASTPSGSGTSRSRSGRAS